MSNMSFLLPAPKRDILAVVQQSQRLCLRRHQDDHQILLLDDGSPYTGETLRNQRIS
jgi:hypothetical protein